MNANFVHSMPLGLTGKSESRDWPSLEGGCGWAKGTADSVLSY